MNTTKHFFLIVTLCLISISISATNDIIFLKNNKATITIDDHIKHPLYWWPKTLLTYEIYSKNKISKNELILTDQFTHEQIPIQITNIKPNQSGGEKAFLHFISDLPSGKKYSYLLEKGIPQKKENITIQKKDKYYHVTTNKFSILIPSSQSGEKVSGPISSISKNCKIWFGKSYFNTNQQKEIKLETKITTSGPLFVEFELHYTFPLGEKYTVLVKCIHDYDFIEIKEDMKNFSDMDKYAWSIEWNNFSPTHRQAPNHPYGHPNENSSGFTRYNWEKIDLTMLNSHHGITKSTSNDGKIPFEVGIFGNWPAENNVTSSVFWDENSNQSIGLFVKDIEGWNSYKYPIWIDTQELSIKFYYKDSLLKWTYPLINGSRTSALSFYSHQKDIDYMNNLERLTHPQVNADGTSYKISMGQQSYNSFLQNRYSTLDLNKVKNWCLTYPDSLPIPKIIFENDKRMTTKEFEQKFFYGHFSNELAMSGPCQNNGYGPTSSRLFYDEYVCMMNALMPQMSKEQRARMTAMFLVHAYIAAGEEYMPMKHMLSGHPNFLSDVKSVPAFASFLFPKHPKAQEWADMFEKYIDLNMQYHVRPAVNSWDAIGGRWTENIGTYLWANLRPSLRANFLMQHYLDGKKRMANKRTAMLGSFVLNSLSAPFNGESLDFYKNENGQLEGMLYWGVVTPDIAPSRIFPPQGAHSVRRQPPCGYWLLGKELENYAPLLSENIRYISRPEDQDAEIYSRETNSFKLMYPLDSEDSGTPPLLESTKINGYGIILRAAVGTEDELSIHLGQIDNGPNYRWGIVGEGGCGTIYFYANGKSYSNNDKEDIGDRRLQDTDMSTGFGVFKDGRFKAIGRNELSRPMYNLGIGQFAEITASTDSKYSWPEYQSRSIMLVGSDYFIIYDDVYNQNIASRFSWYTHLNDDFPELENIKGGGPGYVYWDRKPDLITHTGNRTKGLWFDGTGDFMTFVSHKKGFKSKTTPYGCIITSPEKNNDYIFRNDTPIKVDENNMVFSGTSGFIRNNGTHQEMAIFHGTKIGNSEFEIRPHNTDAGLSAIYFCKEKIKGEFYAMEDTEVTFKWDLIPISISFYIDGIRQKIYIKDNQVTVNFPKGKHIWNLTTGLPDLIRPEIKYTTNDKGFVKLSVIPVNGAQKYRYEYSTDQGKTWQTYKEQKGNSIIIKPIKKESKGYVRVFALNKENISLPSVIYPAYFTTKPPHFPDGLKLKKENNGYILDWGKVLGCNEYRLYKRSQNGKFELIYKGNENQFIDKNINSDIIYQYAISAINGNGESKLSNPVTSDPKSWLNFTPIDENQFRRSVTIDKKTDLDGNKVSSYYPE